MSSYKLIYFDGRGRAEVARLLFAVAGVPYEDKRVKEGWKQLKEEMPQGTLPVLEVDGQKLSQSGAIARFLAKRFGLNGKTDWETAYVDEAMDTVTDIRDQVYKTFFEKDEAKKAEIVKKLTDEAIPKFFKYIETKLCNGDYVVGKELTLADLCVFDVIQVLLGIKEDLFEGAEKVKAYYDRISNLEGVKKWLDNRPETQL